MKKYFAFLLIIIISCKNSGKDDDTGVFKIPGTYSMLTQSIKGDITDTTFTNVQQLKIFTNNYMMYANVLAQDSISAFGIGTYTFNNDTLIENVIYTSSDTTSNDEPRTYMLVIEKTPSGFKQSIHNFMTGTEKVTLTESYSANEKAPASPLDGTWKLLKKYSITGTDTTELNETQYKIYFQGHCIWGTTYRDANNVKHTGIGFGKFEMEGTNKVKEKMRASTFSGVRAHNFDIDIEMDGKNNFKQSITNADGTKGLEIYERMAQN